MSQRRFNDWITAYMKYTDESEAPELFRTWSAVSAIASALRRKCFIEWLPEQTWYPNLYIVLVAPSGRRKGIAMAPARQLLDAAGIRMAADSSTRESLIQELAKATDSKVDPETQAIITHSSITVHSPELTVFLGYNNQQMLADLCDWFDCRDRWKYRTKTQGEDDIIGVWLNLFGATTPTLIKESLPQDAIGGGLTSRIIFVFEEKKGKSNPHPIITQGYLELRELLKLELEKIASLSGAFEPDQSFIERWIVWYMEQEENPPFTEPRLDPYLTRRPMHLMKLAMIMCAARTDTMIMSDIDFERARLLLERTELKMPNVFRGYGKSDISEIIHRVAAYVSFKGVATRTELMKVFIDDADSRTMDRILKTLSETRTIKSEYSGREQIITSLKKLEE